MPAKARSRLEMNTQPDFSFSVRSPHFMNRKSESQFMIPNFGKVIQLYFLPSKGDDMMLLIWPPLKVVINQPAFLPHSVIQNGANHQGQSRREFISPPCAFPLTFMDEYFWDCCKSCKNANVIGSNDFVQQSKCVSTNVWLWSD